MSPFLDSISTIISVFHKQVKEDGDCSSLTRRKMKEFIEREFADAIAKPHDPQTIDKILHFLEWDGDGEIDFNEFLLLAFRVAKACYWYLPKEPYLLQRTKLTTSSKSLREPEVKTRGSRQQLQEEEQQTCERNHHPQCEPDLQRDARVRELERLEGTRNQQRHTQSRKDATRSSEPGEPIPQEYGERSQELGDQRASQRRRQPPEPGRRDGQGQEPRLREEQRQHQEQLADVRSRSQTCEAQPLPNRWSGRRPREPAHDQRTQQPQEADRGSYDQPRRPELLREERSRRHRHELEQKALEESSHQPREPECLDARRPHQSHLQEPLEIDLRYDETWELETEIGEEGKSRKRDIENLEREIDEDQQWDETDDVRRREPMQERRINRQRELDLQVSERRSRQTREREERGATTDHRETRDTEVDRRRQRES
ncbi:PREDICTED: trichohyalin-like, partial [Merops nubicus]|uniref:trichohyalin-like n=1 Tax=Merops nubicus TaxID=57421 RepID=UPI0004F09E5C